jgi:alpha 1,3-glucosidase
MNLGIFWPNPSDTFLEIASPAEGKKVRLLSEGGYFNVFLFMDSMNDMNVQFIDMTGHAPMPPLFSLGWQASKYGIKNQEIVINITKNFTKFKIPMDIQTLDLDWSKGKAAWEWDPVNFGHPKEITDLLAAKGCQLVRINDIELPDWPDHIQYQEAKKARYFIRAANGQDDFYGSMWPGRGCWLDLLNHTISDWYSTKHYYGEGRDFSTPNVFYWNDMNEATMSDTMENLFPKDSRHLDGLEVRETHSIYSVLQLAGTWKGIHDREIQAGRPPQRPYVLTRSFYTGFQKYAWSWTGDNTAKWDQINRSLSMMIVLGLNSIAFTGQDVAGHGMEPDHQILVRWTQLSAWVCPFMRSHSGHYDHYREPWNYPQPVFDRLVKAAKDRYMLIGFWYTNAVEYVRTGRSLVLPLWQIWPEIDAFHDVDSAVVVGDSLFVQPVVTKDAESITLIKPPGHWYELHEGDLLVDKMVRKVTLDDVPVYVRGGRIVPLYKKVGMTTYKTIVTPVTLVIGGDDGEKATGWIYLDDGVGYEFEQGKFLQRNFSYDGKVLKCKKGDSREKEVPEFLREVIVEAIDLYYVHDGKLVREHFKDLKLKLMDEWSWDRKSGSIVGSGLGDSMIGVWIVCGVVVLGVLIVGVIVIARKRRVREVELNDEPLVDSK